MTSRYIKTDDKKAPKRALHVVTSTGAFKILESYWDDPKDGGWGTAFLCKVSTPFYTKPVGVKFEQKDDFVVGHKELMDLIQHSEDPSYLEYRIKMLLCHVPVEESNL